ncbi:MAG: hypothetical protein IKU64_02895 [Bacteroides sp.]|nr:hypothetical protein [Bacteroides sp.]
MKNLTIKKINASTVEASAVPALMDAAGIDFNPIACVNWKEYPYQPSVKFRAAHTGDAILLHYQVTEASVRAVALADDGRVWEDACAEFFLSPEGNDFYYNFECNCAAKLLLHGGPAGGERPTASEEVLKSVKRWASLGTEPFEERVGECSWELALVIPVSAIFRHEIADLNGKTMRGNFYKCGDKLQTPHFLSWSPIDLPQPKFHCPEFFGELNFE